MQAFLMRRAVRAVIAMWGVTTIVFFVMRLSGDPVPLLLPPDAPTSEIFRVRHDLGLDLPLPVQYGIFFGNAIHGDFGRSIHYKTSAFQIAVERLPATLQLAIASFIIAVAVAVPVGVLSAMKPNSLADNIFMGLALLGQSAPTFYIGIMFILVMSVKVGWFPTSGRGGLDHLVGPALTLGAFAMASIARLTRSGMLEVIHRDYIRTARAKGLSATLVMVRHAFKNAAIPIVTIMGLQFGSLLGGAVVTETVFAWPGIGRLAIDSINSRDYPVVQSVVFMTAGAFVLVNLATDLIYGYLDPRIRYG